MIKLRKDSIALNRVIIKTLKVNILIKFNKKMKIRTNIKKSI